VLPGGAVGERATTIRLFVTGAVFLTSTPRLVRDHHSLKAELTGTDWQWRCARDEAPGHASNRLGAHEHGCLVAAGARVASHDVVGEAGEPAGSADFVRSFE